MDLSPVGVLPLVIRPAEVAAVQEYQIGYAAHLLDVAGGQHHTLADDHATDQILLPLRQRLTAGVTWPLGTALQPVAMHAMARQVQDLVGIPMQREHDLLLARFDQGSDAIAGLLQLAGDASCLVACPGEGHEVGTGIADDQCPAVERHDGLATVGARRELPQHAELHRPGLPPIAAFGAAGGAQARQRLGPTVLDHFPGKARGILIEHQNEVAAQHAAILEAVGQQHLEQGAVQFRVIAGAGAGAGDEPVQQFGLGRHQGLLGAGALGQQGEAQRALLVSAYL